MKFAPRQLWPIIQRRPLCPKICCGRRQRTPEDICSEELCHVQERFERACSYGVYQQKVVNAWQNSAEHATHTRRVEEARTKVYGIPHPPRPSRTVAVDAESHGDYTVHTVEDPNWAQYLKGEFDNIRIEEERKQALAHFSGERVALFPADVGAILALGGTLEVAFENFRSEEARIGRDSELFQPEGSFSLLLEAGDETSHAPRRRGVLHSWAPRVGPQGLHSRGRVGPQE